MLDPLHNKTHYHVEIVRTENRETVLLGEVFDGERFEFKVPNHFVKPDTNNPKMGWILVDTLGRNNNRISIVLPAPTLKFGDHISVAAEKIQRAV
jgi:hypothetical protein